ncbi:MAG: hypothetical protein CMK64_05040 [Pseudoalteromonas sp.]|nr:hypothetical protein [Pseudoalteromonas sp.]|tara:strand:- start:16503 stop:17429 length:927 start_codon:yes stop_codon:yes gene_type:complete
MHHVVSFSGGRTSAFLVHLMEQKRIKEGWNVHYIFMDVGLEHPKTYEFIRNVVKHWGINLTCIRAKVNQQMGVGVSYTKIPLEDLKPDLQPWIDMVKKYGLPTINAPRCTSRMKTEPHDKYCDEVFGKGNYTTWLGIRCDEPARLKHYQATIDMFDDKKVLRPIRYLAEISGFTKSNVNDFWSKQPFDLGIPDYLGNCVFCIKKAAAKLYAAAKHEPELADKFREVIMSPDVRTLPNQNFDQGVIYRGKLSIDSVILTAKQLNLDDLNSYIEDLSVFEEEDPSFCSESCEPLQPDDFELEMQTDGVAA